MSQSESLPANADLAVVVIALRNPAHLETAVLSVRDQDPRPEVVVVNSGGGGAPLSLAHLDVTVIEFDEVFYAGAARNRGIEATTAPIVAFLASDCVAESGWTAARLAAHGTGARAVASAVTNAHTRNICAWTSYVLLFNRRMPGIAAASALRYGASYDRSLFDEHGVFREDLRTGEDTEFHRRLSDVPIAWEPRVRTAHRGPTGLASLVMDQYYRGKRSAGAWAELGGPRQWTVAAQAFRRTGGGIRRAWQAAEPGHRAWIAASSLLAVPATAAYALGAARGR